MSATISRPISRALSASRQSPTEFDELWAMTADQRVAAMWHGKLSLAQLSEWTKKRPDEVPSIGGEFAWIAMLEPGWCEPSRPAGKSGS